MKKSNNSPTGRPDFVLPDGSVVDLKLSKLNPDAEKALRKLILEIWGFQIETEDTEESNQKFNSIWQTADSLLIRSLELLGFDCIEDFEADVWAKKPEEASA